MLTLPHPTLPFSPSRFLLPPLPPQYTEDLRLLDSEPAESSDTAAAAAAAAEEDAAGFESAVGSPPEAGEPSGGYMCTSAAWGSGPSPSPSGLSWEPPSDAETAHMEREQVEYWRLQRDLDATATGRVRGPRCIWGNPTTARRSLAPLAFP
jgi:hypothetical protein